MSLLEEKIAGKGLKTLSYAQNIFILLLKLKNINSNAVPAAYKTEFCFTREKNAPPSLKTYQFPRTLGKAKNIEDSPTKSKQFKIQGRKKGELKQTYLSKREKKVRI